MPDNAEGRKLLHADELCEIKYVGGHRIVAIARPGAVTVPAQIRSDHIPVVAQCLRRPIPAAAVIAAAVQKNEWRRGRITPVGVVQAQPLRNKKPRLRRAHCGTQRPDLDRARAPRVSGPAARVTYGLESTARASPCASPRLLPGTDRPAPV